MAGVALQRRLIEIFCRLGFGVQVFHVVGMAGFAFERDRLIENHWISINHFHKRVTFITRNPGVPALQWKLRLFVVVETGRLPQLFCVASGAGR